MHFLAEPETWVAVGFLIFIGVLIYVGVPKMLTDALDARGKRVQAELDEARRLKEEAQKLLAEYKAKRRQADEEAAAIIEGAKADAERIADESKVRMEEFVDTPHQDGGNENRAGGGAGRRRRARGRSRSRRHGGREDPVRFREGQGRRRPDQPRHRRREDEAELGAGATLLRPLELNTQLVGCFPHDVAAPRWPATLGQHQDEILRQFARLFECELCSALGNIEHAALASPRGVRCDNRRAIADGAAGRFSAVGFNGRT